ncbi:MAG TPA: catechol 2,3-dioxygenase [Cycloclasticus sp.]|jgi:catechol 2,3-dioxygenase|nr:catechol 2,3-dioxygenase [Cycloclasticus sp.]HIL91740.1 catechol 2,3-dioxygenase [Cycloclasticus sp.]
MAMTGILRPGHVQLKVLDMEESLKHYCEDMGLLETDRDDQGRVYLKCWDEQDKFSVVLEPSDRSGMDHMAFKVATEQDLLRFESNVKNFGIETTRVAAGELNGCGERVRFTAPAGHTFELYAEKEQVGNGISTTNPAPWRRDLKGMEVIRFDHCLLYGDNFDENVKFFKEALEFQLTEQIVDGDLQIAAFLTCSTKAHDIAFIRSEESGKLHHASFLLGSWEEVLKAADIISMEDIPHEAGPTRHGLTRGKTIYFFDPSGNRNEVFAEDSYVYPDSPVLTWHADNVGQAIFYHSRQLVDSFMGVTS